MNSVRLLGLVGAFLACAHASFAQQAVNYASISGHVSDPSGGTVPGAQVIARQLETNAERSSVTDPDGRFRFPYLPVGPYEIVVRLIGFRDATRRLTLTVGAAHELPIALALEGSRGTG